MWWKRSIVWRLRQLMWCHFSPNKQWSCQVHRSIHQNLAEPLKGHFMFTPAVVSPEGLFSSRSRDLNRNPDPCPSKSPPSYLTRASPLWGQMWVVTARIRSLYWSWQKSTLRGTWIQPDDSSPRRTPLCCNGTLRVICCWEDHVTAVGAKLYAVLIMSQY